MFFTPVIITAPCQLQPVPVAHSPEGHHRVNFGPPFRQQQVVARTKSNCHPFGAMRRIIFCFMFQVSGARHFVCRGPSSFRHLFLPPPGIVTRCLRHRALSLASSLRGYWVGGVVFPVKYSLFIGVHCVEVDARLCAELLFVGVLELWIR